MQASSSRSHLLFETLSLIAIFVVVHGFYAAYLRPHAEVTLAMQAEAMKADPNYVPERTFSIIAKDYEQDVACSANDEVYKPNKSNTQMRLFKLFSNKHMR